MEEREITQLIVYKLKQWAMVLSLLVTFHTGQAQQMSKWLVMQGKHHSIETLEIET